MGQSQSAEPPKEVPIEQLSHELALRFAGKCYTHLEVAHYKDNFKTLADHQEDVEYWKEDTLCRFLALPEPLKAGPVLYQMCTYLGAFPFPTLAPCILTREAMLKVITIMTGRYRKVLRRGDQDKVKLLFRSLAVFDRRASMPPSKEKPNMEDLVNEQLPDDMLKEREVEKGLSSHVSGFAIDEPLNDDEDEDDDDLALAALDALDAIEVFKHDYKTDRKINHAMIPVENLKKLIMLLLLIAGIEPLTTLGIYGESLNEDGRLQALSASADAVISAFDPDPNTHGIRYSNFVKTITTTLPDLFEPFSALFEHFLFSKNINLSKHRGEPLSSGTETIHAKPSPIYKSPEDTTFSTILSPTLLSQLSTSLKISTSPTSSSPPLKTIFTSNARFNQLYSTASHGTSLSSFSRQIFSWTSSTLVLINGIHDNQPILLGAYLPEQWREKPHPLTSDSPAKYSSLFQLAPRHAFFPANTYNRNIPYSYFNNKTGIALGCMIPPATSRTGPPPPPVPGAVSILIDGDMETVTFTHDGAAGSGAFVTDPNLELAQQHNPSTTQPKKLTFDLDTLEVWGISSPAGGDAEDGEDEITKQKKRLKWEEDEAARRRGVNFGGDKDGARALLEMAGLVGDKHGNRSGGSV
ncbi:Restriction of telomere capping protein 5 [Cladophialophora chaetospira]|uniref:Restriction of telomere capping protein 5 n=1 Tax=Cladophialophora chaetospira TaxID=386627 RepID=A0AA38X1N1_9EURO|nr:Restriction of telomere capping protein 5 [Cladophialophora chaetospira]